MIFNILGCMGIGKTTIIKSIENKYKLPVIKEEFNNNPYWKDAYEGKDPEFLKMQIQFMNQYIRNFTYLGQTLDFIIMDQQLYAGQIFVRTQYEMGWINQKDMNTYMERFELIKKLLEPHMKTTFNFYLRDSTENIINKIKQRKRKEEENIPEDFIKRLNHNFMSEKKAKNYQVVDISKLKKGEIPEEIESLIKKELNFRKEGRYESIGLTLFGR